MTVPIYKLTPDRILEEINFLNGTSVTLADVDINLMDEENETWMGNAEVGNTLVRLKSKEGGDFVGEVVCSYDRVDLQIISDMLGGKIGLPSNITSVYGALPYFLHRHGIQFSPDDFEDTPVTWTEDGATFTLTAKPEAFAVIGEIAFESPNLPQEFSELFDVTDLPRYDAYIDVGDKQFAEAAMYAVDFSPSFTDLIDIEPGFTDMAALASIVNRHVGYGFSTSNGVRGLYGCEVEYNGLNTEMGITNNDYKYVMFVKVPDDHSQYEGSFIIHYNDPNEGEETPPEETPAE